MIGHGEKLTRKQDQAIGALLTEQTIAAAAEKVGVGEATLRRWLKLPEFLAAYREARREVMEKTMAQIQQASWASGTTLIKLLGASNESIRLRAAVALLDQANKGLETSTTRRDWRLWKRQWKPRDGREEATCGTPGGAGADAPPRRLERVAHRRAASPPGPARPARTCPSTEAPEPGRNGCGAVDAEPRSPD